MSCFAAPVSDCLRPPNSGALTRFARLRRPWAGSWAGIKHASTARPSNGSPTPRRRESIPRQRPDSPARTRPLASGRMPSELRDMHLADLHERAAAAGIDGYRLMRRDELVAAIESGNGRDPAEDAASASSRESEPERPRRRRLRGRRGGRRSQSAEPESTDEPDTDEIVVEATVLDDGGDEPSERGEEAATEEV